MNTFQESTGGLAVLAGKVREASGTAQRLKQGAHVSGQHCAAQALNRFCYQCVWVAKAFLDYSQRPSPLAILLARRPELSRVLDTAITYSTVWWPTKLW